MFLVADIDKDGKISRNGTKIMQYYFRKQNLLNILLFYRIPGCDAKGSVNADRDDLRPCYEYSRTCQKEHLRIFFFEINVSIKRKIFSPGNIPVEIFPPWTIF